MDNTGAIISPLDYLQVANTASMSNTQASQTPIISSSRQNDRTDYQFVAFANQAPNGNQMVVKDRIWASPSFKTQTTHDWSSLYGAATGTPNVLQTANNVTAYPNPFTAKVSLDISAGLLDKTLTVAVEDIAGRTVGKFEGPGASVNTSLGALSAQLINGTYLLRIQSSTGDFNKVLKIQKLSSN